MENTKTPKYEDYELLLYKLSWDCQRSKPYLAWEDIVSTANFGFALAVSKWDPIYKYSFGRNFEYQWRMPAAFSTYLTSVVEALLKTGVSVVKTDLSLVVLKGGEDKEDGNNEVNIQDPNNDDPTSIIGLMEILNTKLSERAKRIIDIILNPPKELLYCKNCSHLIKESSCEKHTSFLHSKEQKCTEFIGVRKPLTHKTIAKYLQWSDMTYRKALIEIHYKITGVRGGKYKSNCPL